MREEDVRRTAKRAAELIRKNGWVQGMMNTDGYAGGPSARYCALGAIYHVTRNAEMRTNVRNRVERILKRRGFDMNLWSWNDMRGRTQGEVVALLRSAARGGGRARR